MRKCRSAPILRFKVLDVLKFLMDHADTEFTLEQLIARVGYDRFAIGSHLEALEAKGMVLRDGPIEGRGLSKTKWRINAAWLLSAQVKA